ncbi:AsmA family protein [Noviherbaspirillum galbum]|uniref:AsmA family protein n=1 Tax=Noviherbaspirillum galbum TaxID=2709383 RepID=A0A6B3SXD9_9BURK|nr:AsmA family protein [Noviherbaspirillum galbum]NEX63786.1 AsmA family protein [Noviherbaspirillum galbum]
MKKILKIALVAVAALAILLIGAAAVISATFDPNDYKPLIIRQVQEKKQRTLVIPGDIKLSFFPKLGADLGKLSLSEHGGAGEFAAVDHAKVSLALFPLLRRQLVVDHVQVDGLRVSVKRFKDGTTSIDDLLSKDEKGGQALRFDIDGVRVSNARLRYDDRQQDRVIDIDRLALDTGRLADGAASKLKVTAALKVDHPKVDADISLNTGFRVDLAAGRYAVNGLDADIKGALLDFRDLALKLGGNADLAPAAKRFSLEDIKINGTARQADGTLELSLAVPRLAVTDRKVEGGKLDGQVKSSGKERQLGATFSMPSFDGTPAAFRIPALSLDAFLRDAGTDVSAKISGALAGDIEKLSLSSPQLAMRLSGKNAGKAVEGNITTSLAADLGRQVIDLPAMSLQLALPTDGGSLSLKSKGSMNLNLDKHSLASAFTGTLDDSAFDAKIGMTAFSPPAFRFDIGIDKLDLDRYQSRPPADAPQPAKPQADAAADKPIDVSALKSLHAEGSLRVGAFKVRNLRGTNLSAQLHSAGGEARLGPIAAELYGGRLAGEASVAATTPARVSMRQALSGIDVGPLLKDFTGKNMLDGRGNVQLDVRGSGATTAQIKRALDGSARVELKDGAVRGINLAKVIRDAKAKIGVIRGGEAPQSGVSSENEKTDFSDLSASVRIANGIAHNDDLSVKSPLLRIGGAGDIDLGADKLDYLVKATVVSSLQGQGGPELEALKGLTVPVKLSGPFSSIQWHIDFAGLASELARQKVDEKKEEVRSRAQKAIDEQKGKVQEQIQDKLKGLFGR